jgi:lipopolysaccharide transport system permease protein
MPLSAVADKFRIFFILNPITFIIDQAREVALWGRTPNWEGLGLYALGACVVALMGYMWFSATRKGFADVL